MEMKKLKLFCVLCILISLIVIVFAGSVYHNIKSTGCLVLTIAGAWLLVLSTFMYFLARRGGDR